MKPARLLKTGDKRKAALSTPVPEINSSAFRTANDLLGRAYGAGRRLTNNEAKSILELTVLAGQKNRASQDTAQEALTETLITLAEGFRHVTDKHGQRPALMATRRHYQTLHSIHTAALITTILPGAKPEWIIAGLLHDYQEDVPKEREQLDSLLDKLKLREGEIPFLEETLDRLTIKHEETYFSGVERLVREPHHDAASAALIVKLADKISAAQTIWPFTPEKRLRIGGAKIWKVVNLARDYLTENTPYQLEIETMTTQAALAWERAMDWAARRIEKKLYLLSDNEQDKRRLRRQRRTAAKSVWRYIRHGGLERVERELSKDWRNPSGTLYHTMLLGLPLDSERYEPPEKLREEGESAADARRRLLQEQQRYQQLLPLLDIHDDVALRSDEETQAFKKDIEEHFERFPTKERAQEGYQRVLVAFRALQQLARLYALDNNFRLPDV